MENTKTKSWVLLIFFLKKISYSRNLKHTETDRDAYTERKRKRDREREYDIAG